MPIEVCNEWGRCLVTDEVIADIAGFAALECYGLVGMASRKQLKDGIAELLGQDNLSKGVEVRTDDRDIQVDLHIVVSYGVRISEVAHNIQTKVKYVLSDMIGLDVKAVNVFVQGVRVMKSRGDS